MSKYRGQKKVITIPVVHAAQAIFNSAATPVNGVLYAFKSKLTALADGSATYTVSLVDTDGDIVFTKAGIAGAAGTVFTQLTGDQRALLADNFIVRITFSANQTVTDNTVTVTLLTDRG